MFGGAFQERAAAAAAKIKRENAARQLQEEQEMMQQQSAPPRRPNPAPSGSGRFTHCLIVIRDRRALLALHLHSPDGSTGLSACQTMSHCAVPSSGVGSLQLCLASRSLEAEATSSANKFVAHDRSILRKSQLRPKRPMGSQNASTTSPEYIETSTHTHLVGFAHGHSTSLNAQQRCQAGKAPASRPPQRQPCSQVAPGNASSCHDTRHTKQGLISMMLCCVIE